MLKNEFQKEQWLKDSLDHDKVEIPKQLMTFKKSRWQRFLQYLASPTKDPLEPICTSSVGYTSLKVVPIVAAVFITILQILLQ
ncbi:hypothetical protein ACQKMV_18035 [Lysinibacillus sp. NPDC094403]|uniref:hypothetical protein n=1 Tax=Lysinibacillus sp. NPDC094403 TaxID=3390581 RepID=UPI003CFC6B06